MSKEKLFYVYVHRRATDGRVFYVGKGVKDRAWVKKGRNKHWHNIVNKHGYEIEISMTFNSDDCARSFEKALIKWYGFDNLCNLTNGGEGWHGRTTPVSVREKISKSLKENGNHCGMSGKRQSENQRKAVSAANSGRFIREKSGKFKPELYRFKHKDGIEITCIIYDLNELTSGKGSSGHAGCVVLGKRRSVKGWSLATEETYE